jgi:hypothetical protein
MQFLLCPFLKFGGEGGCQVRSVVSYAQLKQFSKPGVGIFADPDNCQAFYLCSPSTDGARADRFMCPDTYLFDEAVLVCNFDYNVDCGTRPRPGTDVMISEIFSQQKLEKNLQV